MPDSSTTTRERDPALPDRVTMPLLALVTSEAVDQDYVQAARRRAAAGPAEEPRRTRQGGAAVVVAIFGLLIALAAVQTARTADVHRASLDALAGRTDQRKADLAELRDRADALRKQTNDIQAENTRARASLAVATAELGRLQISTGFVAVTGPGLRFTVSDSPGGDPDGRVRATDLRRLVNGLWQAGAEAIAINGRRLSAISALVQANIAIQVNRGPLSPPYVVAAIGNASLGSRFDTSTSGVQFQGLADQFGFRVDRQPESQLLLPPAPASQLRLTYAARADGPPDTEEDVP